MAIMNRLVAALLGSAVTTRALYINGSVIAPCDSPIYCHGDILKDVELAHPFSDSKTFVDMPALKSLDEITAAFDKLTKPLSNNTELNNFLSTYFGQAGGELAEVAEDQLKTDPQFLQKINDSVVKEFTEKVIEIWPDLTRSYAGPGNCTDCPSSFIPIKNLCVVAGGRFREPYYWDSYWIIEGLLRTGGAFTQISKDIIENFLDFIEQFGFIPNGGRVYYLNRSQPPLLSQMIRIYIEHTNDTSILTRALPLLIQEHAFWLSNRTVDITKDGKSYKLQRYIVLNTQPRPESFREDYQTATNKSYYANNGIIYPSMETLDEEGLAKVYANLASGAQSGWDYGTRYLSRPQDAARDVYFPLRFLNVIDIVPIDLNSILYANEIAIAHFLNQTGNLTEAAKWTEMAANRSEAIYELMWNSTLFSFFDFNLTSNAQNIYIPADEDATTAEQSTAPKEEQVLFSIAQFYPFWLGAAPEFLKNNPYAVKTAYQRVASFLDQKLGGISATNYKTGQQWDQPNVWPPLQHVLMQGLLNTPATFGEDDPSYGEVQDLALRIGQRYLDSTFCTWYATGGSTSATPKLAGASSQAVGTMFEKYADNATNVAGGGGEYSVVEGFGWTNGVLIWTVDTFGNALKRPDCGNITAANVTPQKRGLDLGQRAVELHPYDASFVKKFGKRAAM